MRELKGTEGWPIALSRRDKLGYVDRTDHGTTGSYAAWPPLSFEALAKLQSAFPDAVDVLLGGISSAKQGPFGQSQAVRVVGPVSLTTLPHPSYRESARGHRWMR